MAASEPVKSHRKVAVGTERNFGLVFGGIFAAIALLPLYHGGPIRWWAVPVSIMFLVCAVLSPRLLRPLNRLWFKFGLLLHHVINPIIMVLFYFGAVVPIGIMLRILGKDPLRLKLDQEANSYWITREPPAPPPGQMTKQF